MKNLLRTAQFIWRHPLNRSGRLAALGRFVRWQVGARLLPGTVALPFVAGTALFARRGMGGATGNWYCGLHEVNDMAFVLHVLRADGFFVDVGANVGSYTLLAAGAVGARVLAVEPIPQTFEALSANIALNKLQGEVEAQCIGLSDASGTLRFTGDQGTVNHVLTEGEDSTASVSVPVRTLDEVLDGRSPVVIKIDVEGHEHAVLRGASRALSDSELQAVILETNESGARYGVGDDALFALMSSYGFTAYGYEPFTRELTEAAHDGGNTLFIRDAGWVADRVRSAPYYRLVNGEI